MDEISVFRSTSLPLTEQPLSFSKFCEEKLTKVADRDWSNANNLEKRIMWLEDHIAHLSGIIYDLMDADSVMSKRWKQFLEVTMAPAIYYNVRNDRNNNNNANNDDTHLD